MLANAGEDIYRLFLTGLRDIVFLPRVRAKFSKEPGLHTSLLRFGSAARALEDAPPLFKSGGLKTTDGAASFIYELADANLSTEFRFGDISDLPSRLTAIIGYNGAGKTRLLARLAMLAYADEYEEEAPDFVKENGRYLDRAPTFGAIIAISYSAFDDFTVPGQGESENAELDRERVRRGQASARKYTYCGLRQVDSDGKVSSSLKSIEQLTEEFHRARKRALEKERVESLQAAVKPVAEEPSFQTITDFPEITASEVRWRSAFSRLSTGHKIVLNIIVQLCAHLERRSIVLFDEPELHLHPPLLAALLRSTGIALERHDSIGIVATHSPVVLQEIPARSVKVLRRYFSDVTIDSPEIETFGENLGLLTKHVFNLDSSDTDYQGILSRLALTHDMDELEGLFDGRMSAQARSLVVSAQQVAEAI